MPKLPIVSPRRDQPAAQPQFAPGTTLWDALRILNESGESNISSHPKNGPLADKAAMVKAIKRGMERPRRDSNDMPAGGRMITKAK